MHARKLCRDLPGDVLALRLAQPTTRATPIVAEALQCPPYFPLIRVGRFAGEQCIHQCPPGRVSELIGEWTRERLDLPVEREPEVLDCAHNHEPFATALPLEHHVRPSSARVPPNGTLGDLRSLDARARHTEAVGEIAERSGNRTPATADRAAAHPCFASICRLLVDHQIKR